MIRMNKFYSDFKGLISDLLISGSGLLILLIGLIGIFKSAIVPLNPFGSFLYSIIGIYIVLQSQFIRKWLRNQLPIKIRQLLYEK